MDLQPASCMLRMWLSGATAVLRRGMLLLPADICYLSFFSLSLNNFSLSVPVPFNMAE